MSYLDKTQESDEEESDVSLLQLCCNRFEITPFFFNTEVMCAIKLYTSNYIAGLYAFWTRQNRTLGFGRRNTWEKKCYLCIHFFLFACFLYCLC